MPVLRGVASAGVSTRSTLAPVGVIGNVEYKRPLSHIDQYKIDISKKCCKSSNIKVRFGSVIFFNILFFIFDISNYASGGGLLTVACVQCETG